MHYYITNLQGDVVQIVDANGTTVATYEYGPYVFNAGITGAFGYSNPIRYRGYYYDTETGFYYLQSRYYDPSTGRFINADSYASTGQGILGNNMFAYCGNNPICNIDHVGQVAENVVFPVCLGGNGPKYTILSSSDEDENSKDLLEKMLSTADPYYVSPQYGRVKSISVERAGEYKSKTYFMENSAVLIAGTVLLFANPPFSIYAGFAVQGISFLNLIGGTNRPLPNQEYDLYSVTTVWESAEYYNRKIVYTEHIFEWELIYNDTERDNPIWYYFRHNYMSRTQP